MTEPSALEELRRIVREREWGQFHSPENLAKGISIEAAELLECFQWDSNADPEQVKDELADVLTYCLLLLDKYDLDLEAIVLEKLEKTIEKYPVEKARGSSEKYDRL
jgi:dCTP diphosphatase